MVITFSAILLGLLAVCPPLQRNPFYVLHSALVILVAYYIQENYFTVTPFHHKTFLLFVVFDFISISLVTFLAYFVDKRAARKKSWRVSETNLHTLEFLGGWSAAYLAQMIFNHKTKKRSYRITFWMILFGQIGTIYIILKFLRII